MVFHLTFNLITFEGDSVHLAYHVRKNIRKNLNIYTQNNILPS